MLDAAVRGDDGDAVVIDQHGGIRQVRDVDRLARLGTGKRAKRIQARLTVCREFNGRPAGGGGDFPIDPTVRSAPIRLPPWQGRGQWYPGFALQLIDRKPDHLSRKHFSKTQEYPRSVRPSSNPQQVLAKIARAPIRSVPFGVLIECASCKQKRGVMPAEAGSDLGHVRQRPVVVDRLPGDDPFEHPVEPFWREMSAFQRDQSVAKPSLMAIGRHRLHERVSRRL